MGGAIDGLASVIQDHPRQILIFGIDDIFYDWLISFL